MNDPHETRLGWIYGLAAYGWWGFAVIYLKAVDHVAPSEVLAHRVIGSVVLLTPWLLLRRGPRAATWVLRSPRTLGALLLSTLLIATNWFTYIWAVEQARVVEASLGYFINPLVNVGLGVVFLHERLRRAQLAALLLAAAAVAWLTHLQGQLPWISLILAFSFGLYGLVRKQVAADALVGLLVETLLLLPAAMLWLGLLYHRGRLSFLAVDRSTDLLLMAGGLVIALPLLWFANAARRLPYSTVGFLQYIAPSIQFLLAISVFGETLHWTRLFAFGLIWAALALFTYDTLRARRSPNVAPRPVAGLDA